MMLHGSILTYLFWLPIYLLGALFALLIFGSVYLKWYFSWEMRNRRGLNYYGKPFAKRRAFKRKIKTHAIFLRPMILLEAKLRQRKGKYDIPSIQYGEVYGPSYSCSQESFQKAATYQPSEQDIFVVTQMKCGTTWMQQVIYEILSKGNGDFSDNGHVHLYATCPWIEALDSVSIEDAPLIGSNSKRIFKTHMPTKLCPYSEAAKYVYVARHPVSCFASIVDYFYLMAGPLAPPTSTALEWYCSDQMWWLSWPEHVAGWWELSQKKPNVLFVHFEEMKKDLESIVRRVAQFLGEDLSEDEIQKVLHKSSFQYMKENEEYFEMVPPNLFSVYGTYFKSGQIDRYKNVSEEDQQKILTFCKQQLSRSSYPAEKFYPDIVTASY